MGADPRRQRILAQLRARDASIRQAGWTLERSNEQFRLLVDSLRDHAIMMLDPAGRVTSWNAGAQRIMQYRADEIVGHHFSRFFTSQDLERGQPDHILAMAAVNGSFVEEGWRRRRDGSTFWASVVVTALRTSGGRLRGYADVTQDISERRKTEQVLRNYSDQLQHLSHRLVQAQEVERRRIAGELHDDVGQILTALKIELQLLHEQADSASMRGGLREAMQVAEQALQRVRTLSGDLRPSLLDDLGLAAALRWHLDRVGQRAGLTVSFRADPPEARLPAAVETACFRAAQEAITNVVRHARARSIDVSLMVAGETAELTVRDDGIGFDVPAARRRAADGDSLGLLTMEERVQLVGGEMAITSTPRQGTHVRLRFPLTAARPVDAGAGDRR